MAINDMMKATIVGSVLLLYAIVIAGLFTWKIPSDNRDIAYMVVGGLTALVSTVVNFFFGSSKSSEDKSLTIDKMAGK